MFLKLWHPFNTSGVRTHHFSAWYFLIIADCTQQFPSQKIIFPRPNIKPQLAGPRPLACRRYLQWLKGKNAPNCPSSPELNAFLLLPIRTFMLPQDKSNHVRFTCQARFVTSFIHHSTNCDMTPNIFCDIIQIFLHSFKYFLRLWSSWVTWMTTRPGSPRPWVRSPSLRGACRAAGRCWTPPRTGTRGTTGGWWATPSR